MAEPELVGKEKEYVNRAIDELELSGHSKYVSIFEEKFAQFIGTKYALMLPNGTLTLHLALRAMGVDENSEVIVPSSTISSVVFSISYLNATAVVVDVDPDTWCMDVRATANAITPRTKVIMPTHIYGGIPARMDDLKQQFNTQLIHVLEDAAEALGSEYRGKKVGSLGSAGSFSLFANKSMTCFPPGTKISTPKGKVNIQDLQVGDAVYSCVTGSSTPYQKLTGYVDVDVVDRVMSRVNDEFITLILSNGNEISVTGNHEFYVVNKGWIRADDLSICDELLQLDPRHKTMSIVKVAEIGGEIFVTQVYNLETHKYHNYFAEDILVHNCGEGGVITTDNNKLYDKMRYLGNMAYGPIPETRFWAEDLGYNYRVPSLAASFALGQLEGIDYLLQRRQDIHSWYVKYLSKDFIWQKVDSRDKVCWWMNAVLVPQKNGKSRRSEFMNYLADNGIESRPTFPPLAQHPYLKKYKVINTGEKNSQYIWENGVLLPSGGVKLTEERVAYVCRMAYEFLNR
jgi:dTDP-4-amino-4,6-dideoxygalactose transaminase